MNQKTTVIPPEELARQEDCCARIRDYWHAAGRTPLAWVDTYGCQQNEADSERIRGMLVSCGYELSDTEEGADCIVVNTCAVREHAETRVFGNVGALVHTKARHPGQKIFLCGCMEYEQFQKVREQVTAQAPRVQAAARSIAALDVLCSYAAVAVHNHYCRPEVDLSGEICITEGRHPVVEQVLKGSLFVPNDTRIGSDDCRVAIITGPNMAGKSTYMRQVALIVLMAQMGSFVPAKSARIGIVDRLFTRIGASDDLASGQSTFMVEMTEVADILRNATPRSLLILDEIGRGTSTFDGMSN